jgi:hypothetical protein
MDSPYSYFDTNWFTVSVNGGSVGNFTNKSQISQAIEIFYNSRSPYGESPIHLFCGPTITDSPNSTDSLLSLTVSGIYRNFLQQSFTIWRIPNPSFLWSNYHWFSKQYRFASVTDCSGGFRSDFNSHLQRKKTWDRGVSNWVERPDNFELSTVIYRGKRLETEGYLTG